jgi:hypothetical protein
MQHRATIGRSRSSTRAFRRRRKIPSWSIVLSALTIAMLAFATVSTLLVWQSRPNESAALPVELIDGDTVRLAVKPIL